MKKILIIGLCLLLIGCNKKEEIKEEKQDNELIEIKNLNDYPVIEANHKYNLKSFEDYIANAENKKITIYNNSYKNSLSISYSSNNITAFENYNLKDYKLYSYSIQTPNYDKEVERLYSLMVYSNCNVISYDTIDEILKDKEFNTKINNCDISKFLIDDYIVYSIDM